MFAFTKCCLLLLLIQLKNSASRMIHTLLQNLTETLHLLSSDQELPTTALVLAITLRMILLEVYTYLLGPL